TSAECYQAAITYAKKSEPVLCDSGGQCYYVYVAWDFVGPMGGYSPGGSGKVTKDSDPDLPADGDRRRVQPDERVEARIKDEQDSYLRRFRMCEVRGMVKYDWWPNKEIKTESVELNSSDDCYRFAIQFAKKLGPNYCVNKDCRPTYVAWSYSSSIPGDVGGY